MPKLTALLPNRFTPPLPRSGGPECSQCQYALPLRTMVLCDFSPARYPCSEERAIAPLRALLLRACGTQGRFFKPRPDAPSAASQSVQEPAIT